MTVTDSTAWALVAAETFRLHPEPDERLFALVVIADTLAEMRARMIAEVGSCHADQLGCCVSVSAKSEDAAGIFAVVYLSRDRLGSGLAAHELTHLAFRAVEAMGLRIAHWEHAGAPEVTSAEEAFCMVVERLTAEFWRNVYALGLAEPGPRAASS